jgi:hypothetical protein
MQPDGNNAPATPAKQARRQPAKRTDNVTEGDLFAHLGNAPDMLRRAEGGHR